jgi:hypothetical protein
VETRYRLASAGTPDLETELVVAEGDQTFPAKLRMALTHLVMFIATEDPTTDPEAHTTRVEFAKKIILDIDSYAHRAAFLLAAMGLPQDADTPTIMDAVQQMADAMMVVAP